MTEKEKTFHQLTQLLTEQRNNASRNIDTCSVAEILQIINTEDKKVADAVAKEIPYITKAVELIVQSFLDGGRLFYVGAGTSGRLGVLDAAECPPTFGTPPELVQGIIAGGNQAMFKAQEGAEDKKENGEKDIEEKNITANDVVCGIAASLRTPYVVGAILHAKKKGATTLYLTTNPRKNFELPEYQELSQSIDVKICPEVGPEVIMGSTRMKSGTAQKLVLNMLTTATMIRLGKVYENMMVDLQLTNAKLVERAKKIIMLSTGISYEQAAQSLEKSYGHVKTAIVMLKKNISYEEATQILQQANGFVRKAIEKN